jgi:hypothetical protein
MTIHAGLTQQAAERPRTRLKRHARRSGFTLVELMASLIGALLLSTSVFLAVKHTSAFYQRESRLAAAQMGTVIGFERLRADIMRAGFMASPNVRRDPLVCGTPAADATWPTRLKNLASLRIEDETAIPSVLTANGLLPQRILLAGNYSSGESFPVRAVTTQGGAYNVYLQTQSGALARLGFSTSANKKALLEGVFPANRAVRIVDKSGRHHYGTIVSVDAVPTPIVFLKADSPTLIFREGSQRGCGIHGNETGASINPINFIRYRLGDLRSDARYAPIYSADATSYDAARTELIREELDVNGTLIAGTSELVAEFAVDLRFRVTVAATPSTALAYVDQSDVAAWAGPLESMGAGVGPQLVRGVHTWLSLRSREADREATIAVASGPLFRFAVGGTDRLTHARVRTLQAHVSLPNQNGITWQ